MATSDDILAALSRGPMGNAALAKFAGCHPDTVRAARLKLEQQGLVVRQGEGRETVYAAKTPPVTPRDSGGDSGGEIQGRDPGSRDSTKQPLNKEESSGCGFSFESKTLDLDPGSPQGVTLGDPGWRAIAALADLLTDLRAEVRELRARLQEKTESATRRPMIPAPKPTQEALAIPPLVPSSDEEIAITERAAELAVKGEDMGEGLRRRVVEDCRRDPRVLARYLARAQRRKEREVLALAPKPPPAKPRANELGSPAEALIRAREDRERKERLKSKILQNGAASK